MKQRSLILSTLALVLKDYSLTSHEDLRSATLFQPSGDDPCKHIRRRREVLLSPVPIPASPKDHHARCIRRKVPDFEASINGCAPRKIVWSIEKRSFIADRRCHMLPRLRLPCKQWTCSHITC